SRVARSARRTRGNLRGRCPAVNARGSRSARSGRRSRRRSAPPAERIRERQTFGPPARTSADACDSYFLKFSRNSAATFFALSSYAALSAHVLRGRRISDGTSGQLVGTCRPKIGSSTVSAVASEPLWIASMIARVYFSLMREPVPYGPPVQPVLTSQVCAPCLRSFSASISAYFVGCHTRNGPPKHGENVGSGSFTPTSVPATFAV